MWSEWLSVEADLELLSPLHVGSGVVARLGAEYGRRSVEDEDGPAEYELTVTDRDGWPCIPGASLKGALSARWRLRGTAFEDRLDRFLGRPPKEDPANSATEDEEDETKALRRRFVAGSLQFFTAFKLHGPDDPLPVAHAERGRERVSAPVSDGSPPTMAERGMEIMARTAIDPGRGVAEEHKLFHEQVVVPGARFRLKMRLNGPVDETADIAALSELLAPLADESGFSLGGGATYGRGRVRLVDGAVRVTLRRAYAEERDLSESLRLAPLPDEEGSSVNLHLECRGPFIVLDSAEIEAQRRATAGKEDTPAPLMPLERNGKPLLPGESLHGALRSIARWLEALEPEAQRERSGDDDCPAPAGWVDRLFGAPGWRGFIHVDAVRLETPGERASITSVRLDRFSGAPIDGGLFTTNTWYGLKFTARLSLRPGGRKLCKADHERFDRLVTYVAETGLELGHGGAKGFGWFDVKVTKEGGE